MCSDGRVCTKSNAMEVLDVAKKLQEQTLDENQSFQTVEKHADDTHVIESEGENAELGALEKERQEENQENTHHPNSQNKPQRVPSPSSPELCGSPPLLPINHKRPLQLVNQPAIPVAIRPTIPLIRVPVLSSCGPQRSKGNRGLRTSTLHGSSDFEDRISSSSEFDEVSTSVEIEDRNSSEEELTVINNSLEHNKRKWSQANGAMCNGNGGSCSRGGCNGSCGSVSCSDAEVRHFLFESTKPVQFSAIPPRGVHKSRHHVPPGYFLSCMAASPSPHKRHKQMSAEEPAFTSIQRPCLDFEKMQIGLVGNTMWAISHGVGQ